MVPEESKRTPDEVGSDELAHGVDSALTDEQVEWAKNKAAGEVDSETARLEAEAREARESALRHQAELENFRKRMRRQMDEERRYAALPLITDLLAVVDNLDRAIQSSEQNESASGLLEGVTMVAAQLQGVLKKHGCEAIEAIGQPFDPHYHEALAPEPSDEHPPNVVTRVMQTGYRLHDRVVRPAQVFVSTANDAPANDAPSSMT
ncbi:MAG: nucleotide exchange factor GrpE [Pirellulaceae bacterium]